MQTAVCELFFFLSLDVIADRFMKVVGVPQISLRVYHIRFH